ncbi:hypothetical protein QUF88_21115 [Bacillus sp. DX1.1]|uniref:hypothetical protein n=1 Tax=unclassified Bacillus (in: firmicutes) TaxID=185979 RepID=UPI0025709C5F|nr:MULTISPECIES: hypothetical protein [unclassified Bacillus (in: firmicutes)]MDM5156213.1 hypothetical protein [Bacillus sp. DX1.1]MDM5189730.1 hypothetical protein [Bacillus sp. DX4.1]WJE80492.1 hypothetical protein QRE67_18650 [Bacillus sp. DX3.1]
MEKRCYECGSKEIEKGTVAPSMESQLTLFAQTVAEIEVCKNCGAVITMKGEHPDYHDKRMK